MRIRTTERGSLDWQESQNHWQLRVYGNVGTKLIEEVLLSEVPEDNPGGYSRELRDKVIKGLCLGWRDLEKFFTQGGVVNKRGIFVPLVPTLHKPESDLAVYGMQRTNVDSFPEGRRVSFREVGFGRREALYIAAPNLFTRLEGLQTLSSKLEFHLRSDSAKWEIMKGVLTGFSKRFNNRLPKTESGKNLISPETAVEEKLFDMVVSPPQELALEAGTGN